MLSGFFPYLLPRRPGWRLARGAGRRPGLLPSAPTLSTFRDCQAERRPEAGRHRPVTALPLGLHVCGASPWRFREPGMPPRAGHGVRPHHQPWARPGCPLPSLRLCASFVFLSEAWSLGPLSLPAVSALPQERLRVSLPLECRGCPETDEAGEGRRGLAALRDDAREWGESGQLPECEQASWALESQAGPQC